MYLWYKYKFCELQSVYISEGRKKGESTYGFNLLRTVSFTFIRSPLIYLSFFFLSLSLFLSLVFRSFSARDFPPPPHRRSRRRYNRSDTNNCFHRTESNIALFKFDIKSPKGWKFLLFFFFFLFASDTLWRIWIRKNYLCTWGINLAVLTVDAATPTEGRILFKFKVLCTWVGG